jgi:DNA repair protein RecO (recombination protein O)
VSRVRLQRNEAIVLKRRDYGEADRILTLYTRERGKVGAIAKGVRRITSRLGGHVELFTHGSLLLAKGRNLDILTQAETLQPFRGLRDDLLRTTYAYHTAELVDRFCEEGIASEAIFELLRDCLDALCDAEDPALIVRHFELRLLGLLGYRPQFFQCVRCDEALEPHGNHFDPDAGGVLCPRCARGADGTLPLHEGVFRVLRFLQTRSLDTARQISLQNGTRADLERIMHAYIRHILERDLRSVEFLERLRRVADPGIGRQAPNRSRPQSPTLTAQEQPPAPPSPAAPASPAPPPAPRAPDSSGETRS